MRNWLTANKLKLNDSKTEFFIAASPYNYKKLPELTLSVGKVAVHTSHSVRNIGAFFDANMTMSAHINICVQKCNFSLEEHI